MYGSRCTYAPMPAELDRKLLPACPCGGRLRLVGIAILGMVIVDCAGRMTCTAECGKCDTKRILDIRPAEDTGV